MLAWKSYCRGFSWSAAARALDANSKAYSKTLQLPKTAFPQWCNPEKSELPYRNKTTLELYRCQEVNANGPLFVLHDGPPYANGNLHMGHALNKILKDIINRFQLLQGRKINYIPGWDCHGLPIEAKTLKELEEESHELPALEIRLAARKVAEREIQTQKREFQELGIMADWSKEGTYRTLDRSYELRQLRLFQKMVEKGLICRSYRPVYFSPSSRSALAEAELNYRDDHVSRSVYVLFHLDTSTVPLQHPLAEYARADSVAIKTMIWTTTPWTLTANMVIAVNPKMTYGLYRTATNEAILISKERIPALQSLFPELEELCLLQGSDLVGLPYHPLFVDTPRSIAPFKVIPASHVTAEFGTGLVHCAPAHGADDYASFRALGLDPDRMVCHVDKTGCYDEGIVDAVGASLGQRLVGLDVLVGGTNAIIEMLQQMNGVLVKEERITHRYPYDWKTDKPVIVTATSQWFTNLASIKEGALAALKDVGFYPPESRNRLESFIRSRSEWCISRQRVWGVPIPSLHHLPAGKAVLTAESLEHILSVLEERGPEYWWNGDVSDFIPPSLRKGLDGASLRREWAKGTDTMDVWFDSGSSWSLLAERGLRSESDGSLAYADVCIEGSDQHRGWFQSMLLTAVATAEKLRSGSSALPYRSLVTHGMVLDQEGKKMSKSLGNVISPMTIIHGGMDKTKEPAYGADVLRYWAASVEFWRDAPLGATVLAQASEALGKIRNTARFILGNINSSESIRDIDSLQADELSIADRYVMQRLIDLEGSVITYYKELQFPRAVQAISHFCNAILSALYFDISKDVLYANRPDSVQRQAVVAVLDKILERLTFMLAPIAPHLAEEIFHYHSGGQMAKLDGPSVFSKCWVPLFDGSKSSKWDDSTVAEEMAILLRLRKSVLGLLETARVEKKLRSSLEAEVDIIVPDLSWLADEGPVQSVLLRHGAFLKTLCIVSDSDITDEGSLGTESYEWTYTASVDISDMNGAEGEDDFSTLDIRIRPALQTKCPRCWTYSRPVSKELCSRCADAVQNAP